MWTLASHVGARLGLGCRKASTTSGPSVVVAGCGVAGVSTALQLAKRGARVTLVDPRPPLTATSGHSTECYRQFFMDLPLVSFMSRSVDIMEEIAGEENAIRMNRRGYVFLTGTEEGAEAFDGFAETASGFGAGSVRRHHGMAETYLESPECGFQHHAMTGFDLVHGSDAIRRFFPFLTPHVKCMLHARRCGWLDSQGLGMAMLNAAKEDGGACVVQGSVYGFDMVDGDVSKVHVALPAGGNSALACDAFVNAAGAWAPEINSFLAPQDPLPLVNELHAKVILNDTLGVIPQDKAAFMVWRDKVQLSWDEETREGLREVDDTSAGGIVNSATWLAPQPGGQHLRPAGNGRVFLLWEHLHRHIPLPVNPSMPVAEFLDMYPQLCVAGLQAMVPRLGDYEGLLGRSTYVDGGYYTVTPDGRPLIGRHGAGNAFVCGGMGTYGLMGAPAAGELVALHVLGLGLPAYARACTWPREDVLTEKPIDLLDDSV